MANNHKVRGSSPRGTTLVDRAMREEAALPNGSVRESSALQEKRRTRVQQNAAKAFHPLHCRASAPVTWSHGVTVSTLDSESSDRGSNPRETSASPWPLLRGHTHAHIAEVRGDALLLGPCCLGTQRRNARRRA